MKDKKKKFTFFSKIKSLFHRKKLHTQDVITNKIEYSYKNFKKKYVTDKSYYPIELSGKEIYDIITKFQERCSLNDYDIFHDFYRTYFTGTRQLNKEAYYMICEKVKTIKGVITTKIIPIRLPALCKMTAHIYHMIPLYDDEPGDDDLCIDYSHCKRRDLKKLFLTSHDLVNYLAEMYVREYGKLTDEVKELVFQSFINAYNSYMVNHEIHDDRYYEIDFIHRYRHEVSSEGHKSNVFITIIIDPVPMNWS